MSRTISGSSLLFFRTAVILAACSLCMIGSAAGQEVEAGADPALTSGNIAAPITIEVFNDYQCPPCVSMNAELIAVEEKYPEQIRFIFRNLPLTQMHKNAMAAARAVEAAGFQGKFREMMNLIYDRHVDWANAEVPTLIFQHFAKTLELDLERFSVDVVSDVVTDRILLDIRRAKFLGVLGTPTLLLNGRKLTAEIKLEEAVRSALK